MVLTGNGLQITLTYFRACIMLRHHERVGELNF